MNALEAFLDASTWKTMFSRLNNLLLELFVSFGACLTLLALVALLCLLIRALYRRVTIRQVDTDAPRCDDWSD